MLSKMERKFQYITVPASLWLCEGDITLREMWFLVEINSLDNEDGCYAGNKHFSDSTKLSKGRCTQVIKSLERKGFITVELVYKDKQIIKRTLRVTPQGRELFKGFGTKLPYLENAHTPIEKMQVGYLENAQEINNNILITNNKGGFQKFEFTQLEGVNILTSNTQYVESIMRNSKLKNRDTVLSAATRFVKLQLSMDRQYNNKQDFMTHFLNWCNRKGLTDGAVDVATLEESVTWFIEKFNALSRKQYKPTKRVQELFETQLANGYTGKEMVKAVENLYSSKNTWHKKQNWVEATPEFLLTGDRMNKYLNAKY